MREFTKSMMSYTWAVSMFGVQQMVNMLSPRGMGQQNHPATDAFNNAAQCNAEQMGDAMRATFRAGDNIQRGLVDLTFGLMTLGASNRNSGRGGWSGSSSGSGWGGGGNAGQGGGNAQQQGGGYTQQASNVGQQTAEAFRQGMGAMGQAAHVAGQAAGAAASGWGGGGGDNSQSGRTGWGPMPSRGGNR
jgi:hypothetical protein